MQASRMIRISLDLREEYSRLKILELLREAVQVAQLARQSNVHPYRQAREEVISRAKAIERETIFKRYPQDLRRFLAQSRYSAILPERMAKIITQSLPSDHTLAATSGELQQILQLAEAGISELNGLHAVAAGFKITDIVVPEGLVSLDLLLPREAFHNQLDGFALYLSRCVAITKCFSEAVTGSRESPQLVYASTSDPVVAFGVWGAVAVGVLYLYERLLDVGLKQIQFLQSLKTLREVTPDKAELTSLEDRMRYALELQLEQAASAALDRIPHSDRVPTERTNELKVEIGKAAAPLLEAVMKGARISITVESLDRIPLIAEATKEEVAQVEGAMESRRILEDRLSAEAAALSSEDRPLLSPSVEKPELPAEHV